MIHICPENRLCDTIQIAERFFNSAREIGVFSRSSYINFWTKQYKCKSGALIIDDDNGIKGILGLVFYQEPWTGEKVATEVCWYSEGKNGGRMMKYAERLARRYGAKVMYVQHLINDGFEKIAKFYDRNNFKITYCRYTKEL